MNMPWNKQPGESVAAYNAFEAVLKRWPEKNITDVYREYTGKPDARVSGRWQTWKIDWKWEERLDAHHQWIQDAKNEARKQAALEKYEADLEDFRRMHENAGKAAFNNVMLCSKILQESAERIMKDKDRHPKTFAEMKQLSGIIGDFMKYAPQVWAEALGISELKEQLEAASVETEKQ